MDQQTSQPLVIVTAPSGSGKTTIVHHLLKRFPELDFSVSACTRPPRQHEVNGRDYYFLTPEAFQEKIRQGAFAEYEMVYEGKYYGTLISELERIWRNHQIPLVDIDVRGAMHLLEKYPQSLSLFIQPPSLDVLRERLIKRGSETSVSLEERLRKAVDELGYASRFHHIIYNDTLEHALSQAEAAVAPFIARMLNKEIH
ncbi:guanylate kinase [Thermoflavifilum aggregans]|uniref:Guanylate kinase n=1 Tax=Thermoflavifilum aggregans TaxID=454188 RepID=A0A2M9CRR2_9BACT|nr:guanylate kinase [Thermoflavifilum aggregans]PJJ74620.1 guanylate kinase [Thermoflavifilum aggregans]